MSRTNQNDELCVGWMLKTVVDSAICMLFVEAIEAIRGKKTNNLHSLIVYVHSIIHFMCWLGIPSSAIDARFFGVSSNLMLRFSVLEFTVGGRLICSASFRGSTLPKSEKTHRIQILWFKFLSSAAVESQYFLHLPSPKLLDALQKHKPALFSRCFCILFVLESITLDNSIREHVFKQI